MHGLLVWIVVCYRTTGDLGKSQNPKAKGGIRKNQWTLEDRQISWPSYSKILDQNRYCNCSCGSYSAYAHT